MKRKITILVSVVGALVLGSLLLQADECTITTDAPLQLEVSTVEAVTLEFDTEAGKVYQIEISETLDDDWKATTPPLRGTGGRLSQLVPTGGLAKAFFRLRDDGDPSGLVTTCPLRNWIEEVDNRTPGSIYQNENDYEISLFIQVSRPEQREIVLEVAENVEGPWLTIDKNLIFLALNDPPTLTPGTLSGSVPSSWFYRISGGSSRSTIWNELK